MLDRVKGNPHRPQEQPAAERDGAEQHDGELDAVLQGRAAGAQLHLLGVVLHGGQGHQGLSEDTLV